MTEEEDAEDPLADFSEGAEREGDPFASMDAPADAGDTRVPADSPVVEDEAAESAADRGDPFGESGPFRSGESREGDAESVWEDLSAAQLRGSVTELEGSTYAEVSKHSYCERCEYFSEPPEISCSHEGTEIVEFVDMETVRLVDCPIVAERRALRREE